MTEPRTIFIGDVHGCFDELKLLLKKINLKKYDVVYFVGDMINKGPDSYKVIKLLTSNKNKYKAIKGNHEVGFLNWFDGKAHKYKNKYYKELSKKLIKHPKKLEYMRNLPTYIETDDFILVHAGIKYDKDLVDHNESELTKIREYKGDLWYNHYKGDKKIIYGHNALDGLQIRKNTIGLDSGCVYGKGLTGYILETGEIYTQNSSKIYENIYKSKNLISIVKNLFKRK